jgi:hypothetical protein
MKEKPFCQDRARAADRAGLARVQSVLPPGRAVGRVRRCDSEPHAVAAMYHALQAMQPHTRHLAKAAIPHVLDWSHEEEIWLAIAEHASRVEVSAAG